MGKRVTAHFLIAQAERSGRSGARSGRYQSPTRGLRPFPEKSKYARLADNQSPNGLGMDQAVKIFQVSLNSLVQSATDLASGSLPALNWFAAAR